jgi:hypothetical protein
MQLRCSTADPGTVMITRFAALILCAAAASQHQALAQDRPAAAPNRATATQAASTTLILRGTIDKYDPSTRILSLSTPSGTLQFAVAATVRIRKGWHHLEPAGLEQFSGFHASVRYSQSGGKQILESVHVFDK